MAYFGTKNGISKKRLKKLRSYASRMFSATLGVPPDAKKSVGRSKTYFLPSIRAEGRGQHWKNRTRLLTVRITNSTCVDWGSKLWDQLCISPQMKFLIFSSFSISKEYDKLWVFHFPRQSVKISWTVPWQYHIARDNSLHQKYHEHFLMRWVFIAAAPPPPQKKGHFSGAVMCFYLFSLSFFGNF